MQTAKEKEILTKIDQKVLTKETTSELGIHRHVLGIHIEG